MLVKSPGERPSLAIGLAVDGPGPAGDSLQADVADAATGAFYERDPSDSS